MNKIGRNSPCPCGSGKKYKKCCWGKEVTKNNPEIDFNTLYSKIKASQSVEDDNLKSLYSYERNDMLSVISLLQSLPENHGKNIRLENIQRLLLNTKRKDNDSKIDLRTLREFFSKNFLHNFQEDPPENLFTENIMTPLGNKIIFPGLAQGQIFFLQQMINAIIKSHLDKGSVQKCLSSPLILLSISDFIAKELGYERNMKDVSMESNDIFVPVNETRFDMRKIFRISPQKMNEIVQSCIADIADIDMCLLDLEKDKLDSEVPDENPIIHKPILFDSENDEYIVLSPPSLLYSALNSLYKNLIDLEKFNEIIPIYAHSCWQYCDYMLYDLGYRRIDFTFEETDLPLYEGLYIFDTDKLAYISFIYDDGFQFNIDNPLAYSKNEAQNNKIEKHFRLVYKRIINDERSKNYKLFNLNILLGIGRPTIVAFPSNLGWESLDISVVDLEVLYKSRKCDNLTLWNYSKATKSINLATPFFLDNITYFINNDESFYTTDDSITHLMVEVGNALDFRTKAVRNYDLHYCEYIDGELKPMTREKLPAELPIYSTKSLHLPFLCYTPILGASVFIRPQEIINQFKSSREKLVSEICIAIAYWLFVLSDKLKTTLGELKIPAEIVIDFNNSIDERNYFEKFNSIDSGIDLFEKIEVENTERCILIRLNEYFLYHLIAENNFAEKTLIRKVLREIYRLEWSKSGIDVDILDEIVTNGMSILSQKKILFKISDFDPRAISTNVVPFRKLSSYALNRELDNLGRMLTNKPYIPQDNLDFDTKTKLVNKIVLHFYEKLRSVLKEYDSDDTILKLYIMYESAVQKRESANLEIVSKIQCFQSYTDIHTNIEKELKQNVEVSLALRCLIEHIVSEPINGNKSINMEAIDTCIACMVHIAGWGFVSDGLNFKVSDTEVSLLKSGRIGTDKTFEKEIVKPYANSKFNEKIYYRTKDLSRTFSLPDIEVKEKKADPVFEAAFKAEFNIPYDDFVAITQASMEMAFAENHSVCVINIEDYKNKLKADFEFDEVLINSFLDEFSLYDRGKVQNVKEFGFKNEDFYPWRYNRKLSLLRKPFVLTKKDELKLITFGVRTLYDFVLNITTLIYNGRLQAGSQEMKSFLSQINNENGKNFTNEVHSFFKTRESVQNIIVKKEVGISSNSILKNEVDLGDIDVLVIDIEAKKVFCIECKYLNEPRTPYEMYLELLKFVDGNNPWISKVDKRFEWAKANLKMFSAFGIADTDGYTIEYLFLTNESISIPFLKSNDVSYRFITFIELQNDFYVLNRKI